MAHVLVNRAKMSVSGAPGTGAITLGSAAAGFETFAAAGVSNSDTVSYFIEDGTNFEWGIGTYSSTGPTLTRTTVGRSTSGAGTAVSLTSAAIVALTALAGDFAPASASEFQSNAAKLLGANGVWTAAEPVALTYAATQTFDLATFLNGKITLTGNVTFGATSNVKKGQMGIFELTHSGGARTVSLNATYHQADGGSITLAGTTGQIEKLAYYVADNSKMEWSLIGVAS